MQRHDEKNDEEIEQYLRKFQPRAVRSLEIPPEKLRPVGNTRWLAATAAVIVAGSISLWYALRQPEIPRQEISRNVQSVTTRPQARLSAPVLTKLALDDSKAFDALLADESRTALPSMNGEHSALRVLAKE